MFALHLRSANGIVFCVLYHGWRTFPLYLLLSKSVFFSMLEFFQAFEWKQN